jgi:hypothetical protein
MENVRARSKEHFQHHEIGQVMKYAAHLFARSMSPAPAVLAFTLRLTRSFLQALASIFRAFSTI